MIERQADKATMHCDNDSGSLVLVDEVLAFVVHTAMQAEDNPFKDDGSTTSKLQQEESKNNVKKLGLKKGEAQLLKELDKVALPLQEQTTDDLLADIEEYSDPFGLLLQTEDWKAPKNYLGMQDDAIDIGSKGPKPTNSSAPTHQTNVTVAGTLEVYEVPPSKQEKQSTSHDTQTSSNNSSENTADAPQANDRDTLFIVCAVISLSSMGIYFRKKIKNKISTKKNAQKRRRSRKKSSKNTQSFKPTDNFVINNNDSLIIHSVV